MALARQMKLGMFLRPAGHHVAAWRIPGAQADAGVNFSHFVELAHMAERGLFDMLFLADTAAGPRGNAGASRMHYVAWLEPFTLMAGLAAVTRRVGLVCTASTTYDEPYHVARRFASLDHITGGRAGWNLVTSANPNEAQNFSRAAHPQKTVRYRRGREFAEIVRGLWDSWDDDAFIRDRQSGQFFDPEKLHRLDHKGEHFQVRGPLNVARPPQGHPVMVQAGASDDGKELAAETADVVFAAQPTIEGARSFYVDLKSRMSKYGRDPDHLKIMPGLFATVGRTREEAHAKYERLQDAIHPDVGVSILSNYIGFDLSGYPVDGPLPEIPDTGVNASRSELLSGIARRENLTIRQLYLRMAGGRGHYQIYGTPGEIADMMEEWFTTGAADGFNFMAPVLPQGLEDFVALVIPELQRRGLFRTQYEGPTLRENLEVPRPRSRYLKPPAEARIAETAAGN